MHPKVTFVMPSCRDDFLMEALDSIKTQTLGEFEVLFYDNSKDGRVQEIKDPRFQVIRTGGWNIPQCHNDSLIRAKTDFLIQAHDDDIAFPEKAMIIHHWLAKGMDIVHGGFVEMNATGILGRVFLPEPFNIEKHRKTCSQVPFPMCGYNRTRVPKMYEDLPIISDYAFFLECWKMGLSFHMVKMPLGYIRIWPTGRALRPEQVMKETQIIRERFNDRNLRAMQGRRIEV